MPEMDQDTLANAIAQGLRLYASQGGTFEHLIGTLVAGQLGKNEAVWEVCETKVDDPPEATEYWEPFGSVGFNGTTFIQYRRLVWRTIK